MPSPHSYRMDIVPYDPAMDTDEIKVIWVDHSKIDKDQLLILHGLIDENVQFQDAARLIQKLIELEKEFEVMVYPMERHGFRTESSRADYCRRTVAFFERHLLRK